MNEGRATASDSPAIKIEKHYKSNQAAITMKARSKDVNGSIK